MLPYFERGFPLAPRPKKLDLSITTFQIYA